jgi:hypothetical protein
MPSAAATAGVQIRAVRCPLKTAGTAGVRCIGVADGVADSRGRAVNPDSVPTGVTQGGGAGSASPGCGLGPRSCCGAYLI